MRTPRRKWLIVPSVIVVLIILGLAGVGVVSIFRRVTDTSRTPPQVAHAGIILPPGFTADVYDQLQGAELPSVVTFDPDGVMYVVTVGGKIFRIVDSNGDHKADSTTVVYDNANNVLTHAVGLAFHDGKTYISDSGRISIIEDTNGDGKYDKVTPIVTGLPSLQFPDHSNNGIVFGPDGKLYIGVGATTDHGPLHDPLEASVLRMNPDGSNLEVFATGFRNPYDLAFSPDGALFTADNNPSILDETLRYLPPEELDQVQQGHDYGFPRVYGFVLNGDNSSPPVTDFYAAVGSAGITYYSGDAFPPEWRNGVYVAQWGTGASVALDRSITNGKALVFVPLTRDSDGLYHGDFKQFLYFDTDTPLRPVDVTVGPDGALYMLEFTYSTVYRIHYDASVAANPTTVPATAAPAPIPTFTAEEIVDGKQIFENGVTGAPACATCHLSGGKVGLGPSLEGLHDVAGSFVPGLNAVDYVRQSILTPNAYIVSGFNANYMFQNYATVLTDDQVNDLVAYVLSLDKP